jgi:hypothetical protein
MLIKSIRFRQHAVLGNLDLDFTDADGNAFRTVILAGSNGAGKTVILENIQRALEDPSWLARTEMDVIFEGKQAEDLNARVQELGGHPAPNWEAELIEEHHRFRFRWKHDIGPLPVQQAVAELASRVRGAAFYSEASVNFKADLPRSITALDDRGNHARSGPDLGTEVTQLLVNLRAADANALQNWVRENPNRAPPPDVVEPHFGPFRRAFEGMFPSKRFKPVEDPLKLQFEEHNRSSSIDQLSTGEKQIVFRAGFLLRDIARAKNSIILIDEPELSLHPEWQERIMGFYATLLSGPDGHHPQIIAATHSPFIVHGAASAKVVILTKHPETGVITQAREPVYPGIRGGEAVRAFNIDAFLEQARKPLLVLTEGESDAQIIRTAWEKLRPGHPMPFEARAAYGAPNISGTLNRPETFAQLGDRKIVGLFDFDSAFDRWSGVWKKEHALVSGNHEGGMIRKHRTHPGWAMLLPVPPFRTDYASQALRGDSILSIEFMFEDVDFPHGLPAYRPKPLSKQEPYVPDSQKAAFAEHVRDLPAGRFAAFKALFLRFDDILAGRLDR